MRKRKRESNGVERAREVKGESARKERLSERERESVCKREKGTIPSFYPHSVRLGLLQSQDT